MMEFMGTEVFYLPNLLVKVQRSLITNTTEIDRPVVAFNVSFFLAPQRPG